MHLFLEYIVTKVFHRMKICLSFFSLEILYQKDFLYKK